MQDPKESCNETRKTHTNANEMPPGSYNDLANVAAWLEKFSEQAVVTRVNLVGNLVGCLSHIGEVDEDRPFGRAKESITQSQNSSWKRFFKCDSGSVGQPVSG